MHLSFVCAHGLINYLSCSISSYTNVIDYASLPCFHYFGYQLINVGVVLKQLLSSEEAGEMHSSVPRLLKVPEEAVVAYANQWELFAYANRSLELGENLAGCNLCL